MVKLHLYPEGIKADRSTLDRAYNGLSRLRWKWRHYYAYWVLYNTAPRWAS